MSGKELSINCCFICGSTYHGKLTLHDILPYDYKANRHCSESKGISKEKRDVHKLRNVDTSTLDNELSVFLLLRKVLCLSKGFLESVLHKSERNPSSWGLKLCDVCFRIFSEASFVWSRLKKIHEEFEDLSQLLRSKLIHSSEVGERCSSGHNNRHISGKQSVRLTRAQTRTQNSESTNVETASTDICHEIRKEFITQFEREKEAYKSIEIRRKGHEAEDTQTYELFSESFTAVDDNVSDDGNASSNQSSTSSRVAVDNLEDLESSTKYGADYDDFEQCSTTSEIKKEGTSSAEESGSDFEAEFTLLRKKDCPRRRRKVKINSKLKVSERGMIYKALKIADNQFECPKCNGKFENSSFCNEHILRDHYDGKWPQDYTCHICENRSFSGPNWLRFHLKMRHPGAKLASDEILERSIKEGIVKEIKYDVEPVNTLVATIDNQGNLEAGMSNDNDIKFPVGSPQHQSEPGNKFSSMSMPILQRNGEIRNVPLPPSFSDLPDNVLDLFREGFQKLSCKICEQKFLVEMQLKSHMKRTHEGELFSHTCPLCPKTFERVGHMITHMEGTHTSGRFHCDRCGKMFKESIVLNAHIQRAHLGIEHPYSCIKCGLRYSGRSLLNKHLKRVHNLQIASYLAIPKPKKKKTKRSSPKRNVPKKFKCEICENDKQLDIRFATEEELDVHTKRKHLGIARPYPCPICNKKYSRPNLVEEHMHIHTVRTDDGMQSTESESTEVYVCIPCNKQFNSKSALEAHLQCRNHKNFKPFVCELCSQTFRGLRYLQNHQSQKHHSELKVEPHICQYCGKILSSARTLDDHVRVRHTKNAKFICPHCDVVFQHESAWKRHINVRHTKTEDFLCPQCPKVFSNPQYLSNHMRVHTGEKPYECKFCAKKFSDKPTFNRHVEAHSNVLHDCPTCKKTGFKTRHALGVHMKKHGVIKSANNEAGVVENTSASGSGERQERTDCYNVEKFSTVLVSQQPAGFFT